MTSLDQQAGQKTAAAKQATKEPLRVGLMIDSYVQPRWIHRVIADIQSSTVANLVLIIKNEHPAEEPGSIFGKVVQICKQLHLYLYKAYLRIDAYLFAEELDAFEKVSIESLLPKVPVVRINPIQNKFIDEFTAEDSTRISEYGLDVALRFGFRILKGRILRVPKFGVWSYHHGDNLRYRGGPPGFWEVMEGEPSIGAVLQILSEELDNGHVIYRSVSETDPISVRRSINTSYWQSSAFVSRKLRDVYDTGRAGLSDSAGSGWKAYSGRLYRAPTNGQMLRFLGRVIKRYLRAKARKLFYLNQWFLAYKITANEDALNGPFYQFKHLVPSKNRFWADPFPVKKDGKHYIFFEELLYRTGKGHLSVMEVDRKGIVSGPHKILERPYHLSYPFVFSWNEAFYMVPETGRAGRVELYRCTSFPEGWELDRVLLTGVHAVDTTLAEIDGFWWMFTSIRVEGTKHLYELHLYYACSPLGPWKPHRSNPVRPDGHSSRPAGRIVKMGGSYYRPAQEGPGNGISIYRIERLNPESYAETEVCKILPNWADNLVGTHTLNSSEGLTVIDGLLKRRRYFSAE